MIRALGRQRQVDLCEFKASLVYRVSSRVVRATEKPYLKNKQTKNKPTTHPKQTNKQTNKQKQANL